MVPDHVDLRIRAKPFEYRASGFDDRAQAAAEHNGTDDPYDYDVE